MNKIALITGASRGIGKAIALQLAQEGIHVVLNYRSNHAEAEKTLQLIMENGGSAELLPFDVANTEETIATIEHWQDKNKGKYISILVNNAGIRKDNLLLMQPLEDWEEVISTNLNSFFTVTKAVIKDMLYNKYGRIINISSLSGVKGMPGQTNYAASKGGLIAASKSLALEVARKNITVNVLAPGFIETDMTESLNQDELKKVVPMQRFGKAEEVAGVVSFLVGSAAGYITGETININGGLST